MTHNVVVTEPAVNDLHEIKYYFDYIVKLPPGQKILRKISDAIKSLKKLPSRHTVNDARLAAIGVRAFPVESYIIFYTIEDGNIVILRILHSSRNWGEII
ncbi:MAG: type II toxin-antitoxin system RelE/ParE family toxin [Deferribacteraceae bacterium]|jgi:addiction module RelE/StbE family toxin|nr:type II toxin-antitoxin system RelE/ParE family toxin [Deferribacteraceae bacterium]